MFKAQLILLLPLLISCTANMRMEDRYVDDAGVVHDCGIGQGLTPCNKEGEAITETNDVLEKEAESLKTDTPEEFEQTVEFLESGGFDNKSQ